MTDTGTLEFKLSDSSGNEHHYLVVLHDLTDGLSISTELISAGGPALGRLIGAFVGDAGAMKAVQEALSAESAAKSKKDKSAEKSANDAMWAALTRFAVEFDWSTAGLDLQTAIKGLSTDIIPRILKNTIRGTEDLGKGLDCFPGNYAELYQAAFTVARFNGFFPVPTSLAEGSKG